VIDDGVNALQEAHYKGMEEYNKKSIMEKTQYISELLIKKSKSWGDYLRGGSVK